MSEINIKKLAQDLERLINKQRHTLSLPNNDQEIGTRHLAYMCRCVYNEWVSGDLAIIWVGYVQGVVRAGGGPNVKELAEMIREAREGRV